ncbi:MAG TPA: ATP-binding protein [Candidatus Binataceae bacterium]|nr:ATP-binding protein [Candidatus Binataceae bacterium]
MDAIAAPGEEGRTTAILETLDVGAIVLDLEQTVTHLNEIAALILDIPKGDAIGRSFFALDNTNLRYVRVREALAHALTYPPGEQQAEVRLHLRGRDHVYILKPAPLCIDDVGAFGTIVTLHDVTYLRDKERAKTNLIAALSNELKTPLTSLSLGIELLQRETVDPKQHQIIDTVSEDLERIRDLSDGLLNVTRDETLSITVKNSKFQLGKLVASVAKKFALQALQKEIAFHVHIDEGLESFGDPMKLAWVVSNLIANALRYTPEGGSVEVSAIHAGSTARLSISATGSGIPRDLVELVFEQDEHWQDELKSGLTVIDLAIAKEIVEAHGGRMFFETTSAGSSVRVDLPHSR